VCRYAPGEAITSGLRKVTDDMKAKNRADRSGVVVAAAAKPAANGSKPAAAAVVKPPKFALEVEGCNKLNAAGPIALESAWISTLEPTK
jgi:hypothetical protein